MPPEFFDSAEIALNEGGQSWGNLGLWRDNDSYSDACRELALLLGLQAGLNQYSHVLDVGFGCGDQLLVWLEHFRVATLQGVNLSTTQTKRAIARLQQHGHVNHCQYLIQGDVSDSHLWPAPGAHAPNRILCLDSAYHFPDRHNFFAHAARSLPAGGKLCLTDFVLPENSQPGFSELPLRAMLRVSRIPRANIVRPAHYSAQLANAGFDTVEVMDISESVMAGFAGWWTGYRAHAGQLAVRSRLKYSVTARFLQWAYRKHVLRYVMISAERS